MNPPKEPLRIVIIGLSITSSWGNGHATTYRGLCRELGRLGHNITFLEKDVPWYHGHRDLPNPDFCKAILYGSNDELRQKHEQLIANADLVIVGSYVQQGVDVGWWVVKTARGTTAFYDIDTPLTLAKLGRGDHEYINPELIPQYDLYLSFSGGKTLTILEEEYGSPKALPLYCSVDPEIYFPEEHALKWDMGYLGTYSTDRQPPLNKLMLEAARACPEGKFVVAGPQYPETVQWPENVERIEHLPPGEHRAFYNSQRLTLNITRADMIKAGHCPSVRLFEAAACGVPIVSDYWEGLETIFEPGREILVSESREDTLHFLKDLSEDELKAIGEGARKKILARHTSRHRAEELVEYYHQTRKVKTHQ